MIPKYRDWYNEQWSSGLLPNDFLYQGVYAVFTTVTPFRIAEPFYTYNY